MSTPAQSEFDSLFSNIDSDPKVHPEDLQDKSDSSSDDGSTTLHSSDQHSTAPSTSSTTMPTATYLPNTTQFDANTGPKGVIADARSFETARKRSFRQTLYAFADSAPFKKSTVTNREKSKSPSPDLSADEEEDDFMRTWRAKRLNELSSMKQEVRTRSQSPSQRRYGSLVSVDAAGYLDAVEKYGASNKVEDALKDLARKYVTIRFIRLHYLEAEMDEIAVPGVLAYKTGDCFANLVSFINELPAGKEISTATVEEVLQRNRILV